MCRIIGRVSKDTTDFSAGLKTMIASVAHGGPDDEGVYHHEHVWLGHRRLSIIDLTMAGHQPMQCESVVISFNGEIYNYQDLRKELQASGFIFNTQTDTEVILKAYMHWGTDAFDKLEGIFAFAIHDQKRDLFFLVRDHLGVKPLYYFLNDHELIFSSEVRAFKALRKEWKENDEWKILFLAFGSVPHPFTTLDGVVQLAPGTYLQLQVKAFTYSVKSFYHQGPSDYTKRTVQETLAMMQFASRKAFRKNLISDAPLGIFLSGGIDSSLLTLMADQTVKNVKTISVNFDDAEYDEYPFQKMVLEKTQHVDHTIHRVTETMFWEQLDDVWKAMDQPSIDGVNTYFVTRCAKRDGIKAVLSGLGADEIFGGYASFDRIKWMRRFRQLPVKKSIAKFASSIKKSWGRLVYLTLPGAIGDYLFLRGIFTPVEIASLLNTSEDWVWKVLQKVSIDISPSLNDVEYASQLESKIYMTNQLLKDTDYMGMWHGVEVRVPFLDIEMLKKVWTIDPTIRYKKGWPKFLITASNGNILPHEIVFRKKKGFTFPFAEWLKKSPVQFKAMIQPGSVAEQVCLDFEHGHCHWSKYWSLAVLQQFK